MGKVKIIIVEPTKSCFLDWYLYLVRFLMGGDRASSVHGFCTLCFGWEEVAYLEKEVEAKLKDNSLPLLPQAPLYVGDKQLYQEKGLQQEGNGEWSGKFRAE